MVFFNQAWRAKQLPVGTLALFFGSIGSYRDALQLNSPMVEVLELAGGDGDDPADDGDREPGSERDGGRSGAGSTPSTR